MRTPKQGARWLQHEHFSNSNRRCQMHSKTEKRAFPRARIGLNKQDTGMINKSLLAVAAEVCGTPQQRPASWVWHEPEIARPIRTMWSHQRRTGQQHQRIQKPGQPMSLRRGDHESTSPRCTKKFNTGAGRDVESDLGTYFSKQSVVMHREIGLQSSEGWLPR